ncbi:MAG: EAL domain-containing protein [Acidobacteria bacterium]|nr:EAL domain-containing protein [Acidobacteriota bacterium]
MSPERAGFYRTTVEGRILSADPQLARELGYANVEELLRRDLSREGFSRDHPRVEFLEALREVGEVRDFKSAWLRRDGGLFFVSENAHALRAPDGSIVLIEGVAEPFDARRFTRDLGGTGTLLRALVARKQDLLIVLDAEGSVRWVNSASAGVLGQPPAHLLAERLDDLVHPDDASRLRAAVRTVSVTPRLSFALDVRVKHQDGTWRSFEANLQNALEDPGIAGLLLEARDVTSRRRSEEALRLSHERLRLVLDATGDGIFEWDVALDHVDWSDRVFELLGRDSHAPPLRFRELATLMPPEDADRFLRALGNHLAFDQPFDLDVRIRREPADLSPGAFLLRGKAIRDAYGRPLRLAGALIDTTSRREAEEALLREAEFRRVLLESVSEGVVACDGAGRLVLFNRAARDWHGAAPEPLRQESWPERYDLFEDDGTTPLPPAEVPLARALAGETVRERRMAIVRPGTPARHVVASGGPLASSSGERLGAVIVMRDVTHAREAEARLRHEALHDALTGLPNRALFLDRLQHAFRKRRRSEEDGFAVLFLDLDRFKIANDSLGHLVGDDLLVAVARRLERAVRPGDTVARFGGDEFTVLLDPVRALEEAASVADRIAADLSVPVRAGGRDVPCSVSIGIALGGIHGNGPDDLLRNADLALYRAKAAGRARREVYEPALRRDVDERLELEHGLRHALSRDELTLHYQPVLAVSDGRLVGFEALVRWRHPELGLVLPGRFVPIAEDCGLAAPLGRWALVEALLSLQAWKRHHPAAGFLRVSVNVSPRHFTEGDLVADVLRAFELSGAPPSSLEVEITESLTLEPTPRVRRVVECLRNLGVGVLLDDFGTGFSTYSLLQALPVSALKIDRSFIARMRENPAGAEIVRSLVTLAHELRIEVVAEGVELAGQLDELSRLACDRFQGFLVSPPRPAEEVPGLFPLIGPGPAFRPR